MNCATHSRSPTHGVITDQWAMCSENSKYNSFSLVFDVTVAKPLGPIAMVGAGIRSGFALEGAFKAKDTKYGGI